MAVRCFIAIFLVNGFLEKQTDGLFFSQTRNPYLYGVIIYGIFNYSQELKIYLWYIIFMLEKYCCVTIAFKWLNVMRIFTSIKF